MDDKEKIELSKEDKIKLARIILLVALDRAKLVQRTMPKKLSAVDVANLDALSEAVANVGRQGKSQPSVFDEKKRDENNNLIQ